MKMVSWNIIVVVICRIVDFFKRKQMIFWPETAKSGTWGNSIVNKLPRNGSVVVHENQSASIWYHLLSATLWFPFHPVPPQLFQRHVGYKWPAIQPKWCPKFIALVSLSFLQIIMVHWTPSRVMKRNSMDNKPSHQNSCNSNPSKHPFDTMSWCAIGHLELVS